MKFVLLSVVCLAGVALALPASNKQKRDILPGDPRYGTDYHHHHHQHHEDAANHPVPHAQYGPPQHQLAGSNDHVNNGYLAPSANSNYAQASAHAQSNAYLAPAASASKAPAVQYTTQAPAYHQHVPSNNYLGPAIQESIQKPFAQYGPPREYYEDPIQTHVLANANSHAEQQGQQSVQNHHEQISGHQPLQANLPNYQAEYNSYDVLGDAESSGVQQLDQTVLAAGGNNYHQAENVYHHQYDAQPKAPAQHYIPQEPQHYQPAPSHQDNTQLIGANGGYVY